MISVLHEAEVVQYWYAHRYRDANLTLELGQQSIMHLPRDVMDILTAS